MTFYTSLTAMVWSLCRAKKVEADYNYYYHIVESRMREFLRNSPGDDRAYDPTSEITTLFTQITPQMIHDLKFKSRVTKIIEDENE